MLKTDKPIDWVNISIDEYYQIQDLIIDNPDNLEQEDIIMQEIQILYNKNPYNMTMPEFKKCMEGLKFLSKPIPKMKLKDTYMLQGNQYTLHKKLEEFKVAQYVDYENIMKTEDKTKIHPQLIALWLRPTNCENYNDGYDVATAVKDISKYMSIADAFSITNFFFRQSKAFIIVSLLSSLRMMKKNIKDRKRRKELMKKTRKMMRMVINGV